MSCAHKLGMKGRFKPATLQAVEVDPDFVPDVSNGTVLSVFKLNNFKRVFPRARIVQGND